MARTTSPEKINAQRLKVLEKAAELFAEKGFHATSVDDIAKALNLTKGSVYYYIPTKDEILFQVHDYALDLLLENAEAIIKSDDPPDLKLRRIITSHILSNVTEMSVVAALLQMQFALTGEGRAKIVEKRDRYDRILRQVIRDGINQRLFIKCDPTMVSFFILGFINYIPQWYKEGGRLSKQAIADQFADLALRAILVDRPDRAATRGRPTARTKAVAVPTRSPQRRGGRNGRA